MGYPSPVLNLRECRFIRILYKRLVSLYLTPDRPYIDKTVSSKVVKSWLGHAVILKCVVDANPAANFTWYKDGRLILRDINSTHNKSTLSITTNKSGEFGSYLCKAANIKGTTLHNITVEQLCECHDL